MVNPSPEQEAPLGFLAALQGALGSDDTLTGAKVPYSGVVAVEPLEGPLNCVWSAAGHKCRACDVLVCVWGNFVAGRISWSDRRRVRGIQWCKWTK